MNAGRYDALIFDMNGVLVDDEPLHFLAFKQVLAEMGYPLTEEEYNTHCLGRADRDCFLALLAKIPGADESPDGIARGIAAKGERYMKLLEGAIPLMPHAKELLSELHARGYRMALVTGAVRCEAEMIVSSLGARAFFTAVVAGEDVQRGKPHPEPFLTASERLGVPPERCLVVEDSVPGLRAAKAAGMSCAILTSSYPDAAWDEANYVIGTLNELIERARL